MGAPPWLLQYWASLPPSGPHTALQLPPPPPRTQTETFFFKPSHPQKWPLLPELTTFRKVQPPIPGGGHHSELVREKRRNLTDSAQPGTGSVISRAKDSTLQSLGCPFAKWV